MLGAWAFSAMGWTGTCALGTAFSLLGLAAFFGVERRAAADPAPSIS
jgi:hypothetical protein